MDKKNFGLQKFSIEKPLANKNNLFRQKTLYNSKLNKIYVYKTKRILRNRSKSSKIFEKREFYYAFDNQMSFFYLNRNN